MKYSSKRYQDFITQFQWLEHSKYEKVVTFWNVLFACVFKAGIQSLNISNLYNTFNFYYIRKQLAEYKKINKNILTFEKSICNGITPC
jgi:hypothetical protein